jgi:alkylation response protein AidB-like acyl-CoA dehydrogenase
VSGGRINIGACSVGGAAFCLGAALEHASVRSQFGQHLRAFQAVQFKLADMATSLHASRLMVRWGSTHSRCRAVSSLLMHTCAAGLLMHPSSPSICWARLARSLRLCQGSSVCSVQVPQRTHACALWQS